MLLRAGLATLRIIIPIEHDLAAGDTSFPALQPEGHAFRLPRRVNE